MVEVNGEYGHAVGYRDMGMGILTVRKTGN